MKHESIEALIHLLNQPEGADRRRDRVFISALNEWVDFAVIWREEPCGGIAGEGSAPFYFIKDSSQYVAAVFDMGVIYTPSHYRRLGGAGSSPRHWMK